MGFSVLLTAGLSFVGAGIRVPTAEWGSMISLGAQSMVTGEWWISVFPGLALGVTVLSLGLVGDALRAYLDPTRRV
jgi:peptide/nickel transport system permease protein